MMSDPKQNIPQQDQSPNTDRDDINWTLYDLAAESIRAELLRQDTIREQSAEEGADSADEKGQARLNVRPESGADNEAARKAYEEQRTYTPGNWPGRAAAAKAAVAGERPAPAPARPADEQPESGEKGQKKKRRVQSTGVTVLVAILYAVSVLSIAFLTATLGWRWANDLLALNKEPVSASVTIKAGEGIHDVAEKLEDYGLIEYPVLFEVFAGFTNKAERITSGTYQLNTNMDYSALLSSMSITSSAREEVEITIPEGFTVKEVFELLDSMGACTVEELEHSALNDEFDYSFLKGLEQDDPYWMEGYLYPDTYMFYKDGDAKVALSKMLYNYSVKFDSESKTRAERLGYSQHEIMIIASIIEKETDGSDQKDIASVVYNRLQTSGETLGKLQMDSTIQYALEERKEHLTQSDLEIDSPYNTYLYAGLPSGTICNPGMEAIQAALYPNSTSYYFFILGNDGVHHYFETYDEFINFRNSLADTAEETE